MIHMKTQTHHRYRLAMTVAWFYVLGASSTAAFAQEYFRDEFREEGFFVGTPYRQADRSPTRFFCFVAQCDLTRDDVTRQVQRFVGVLLEKDLSAEVSYVGGTTRPTFQAYSRNAGFGRVALRPEYVVVVGCYDRTRNVAVWQAANTEFGDSVTHRWIDSTGRFGRMNTNGEPGFIFDHYDLESGEQIRVGQIALGIAVSNGNIGMFFCPSDPSNRYRTPGSVIGNP